MPEDQYLNKQPELAKALQDAYGLNTFACIFLIAAFITGLDNMNYKLKLVRKILFHAIIQIKMELLQTTVCVLVLLFVIGFSQQFGH